MPDIFSKTIAETKKSPFSETNSPKDTFINYPGLFCSFANNPQGFKFAQQEKNENILLLTRRHFITNFPWIISSFIFALIPPTITIIWQFIPPLFKFPPITYILLLLSFYYTVIAGYAFYNFINWFYNIGLITNKRIFDLDYSYLSYIDVAITQLPEIEDVVHRQKGFFASFFNYGDVVAHTVAGHEDFIFEKIPHPTKVVDVLSKLIGD